MCVCLSTCYQHDGKRNNSRNNKFGILRLYPIQMFPEIFIKIGQKLCVPRNTKNYKTLRPMERISSYLILTYFNCSKYNKINMPFIIFKNLWTIEQGMNGIHNLSSGSQEEIWMYEWFFMEISMKISKSYLVFYEIFKQ